MDAGKQSIERIRDIFTTLRDFSTDQERDEYLNRVCGDDADLRKEVESLLAAYKTTDGFLNHDVTGEILVNSPDLPGTMIAGYRIVERIGEGGFGEVYRAEQTKPLQREVALKVIKLGMDSRNVIARFEAERQALACMNHPGIAHVYDAGITETGRPYFVMELVHGLPLIDYCDRNRLPLPERLHLFRQICEAIQHAHQKGILHRDLKPSNILVSDENGQPRPKIIDFGVAKSLEGRLTEQTLATLREMLIGTPMYMSPEQLDSDVADTDTRSDIYSLGIILYELVAGTPPLGNAAPGSIAEMRNAMKDTDFIRPSRLVRSMGEHTTAIAGLRQIKPIMLQRLLRGDLDWVVMKAIEKERDRRYEDIGTLSKDLERFLNHEPVSAGPPSLVYRGRKFIRRHRMGSMVAACFAVSLLLGTVVSSVGFIRASQAAERARLQEIRARQEAERARQQESITEATYSFFTEELVSQASPSSENSDRDIKLRTAIDQASRNLEDCAQNQPEICARIHRLFSSLYIDLGDYDKALFHAKRSMALVNKVRAKDDPVYLEARLCLADAFFAEGHKIRPRNIYRNVLDIQENSLGPNHPDTLSTLRRLAPLTYPAIGMYRRIVETKQRELGPEHLETLQAKADLANYLSKLRKFEESEAIYQEVVPLLKEELGDAHPITLNAVHGYGALMIHAEKLDEAERILRELLEIKRDALGPEHPDTLGVIHDLAIMRIHNQQYADAEQLLRENLAKQKQTVGSDHPDALSTAFNLAHLLYLQKKQLEEAETLAREVMEKQERIYTAHSFWTWPNKMLLAEILHERGKHGESEMVFRRLLEVVPHSERTRVLKNIANELRHQGKPDEAEQFEQQNR